MMSALAFYIYKHKVKTHGESQKLVGENSRRTQDPSTAPPPPSTFLYIGTVEPPNRTSVGDENGVENGSPYRKLKSVKRSDRYRPSPDLQPLPPLPKPPLPTLNSPPPMSSSSDEESQETAFYTPQGSSVVSNDEGSFASGSRMSYKGNNANNIGVPHSKRTSPKSRLLLSSPPTAPPPPPSLPLTQINYSPPISTFSPKRPKFAPPPPPPNMARLQAITTQALQTSKIPPPPPPPPPPNMGRLQETSKIPRAPPPPPRPPVPPQLPLSTPRKLGGLETSVPFIPLQELKESQSRISNSRGNYGVEKTRSVEEVSNGKGVSSSERGDGDDADESRPKLKPLHWDKVRASPGRGTVWDQLKSSSFQLNEDMMESLFGCNSANSAPKEATRRSVFPPVEQENRVLDPKKSQNIAILLRALNVTRDEVSEALLDGNPEGLGAELLETLVKMAPTKEEEIKLRGYKGDISKLGTAERFLKTILDIPFAFKRVEAMLYRANFDSEIKYLRKTFQTLEAACEDLKNSRLFLKLLEAVLRTGNRMNVGTNRGDARAFKLETLLKLADIKGTDGKTTLLHFVVQEIIRSEGAGSDPTSENLPNRISSKTKEEDFKKQGLEVVSGLSRELGNVKKAAAMDSDVLSSYLSKLEIGLEKVRVVLQYQMPNMQGKFFESMRMFLKEAEEGITRIKAEERKALSLVKEVTEYFHGNTSKEEAHPFRIFMIVRDFLSILDNVCKEVGRMQDHRVVGASGSFRIPANVSLPVLNRYNVRRDSSSDDESLSP